MDRRVKNPGSKPVKWNEDRPRVAYLLALLGATEANMAEVMQVDADTITRWKIVHPEFLSELERGKLQANMQVAESFFLNCIDRWIEVEEIHVVAKQVVRVKVKKFIQGDKWAQAKWLALRQRDVWSEVAKVEITNTNVNVNKLDLSDVTTDQLRLLRDIGLKQLKQENNENGY